jgi:putative permease
MKFDRVKALQNIGIIALILISLYYLNLLFGNQLSVLFTAINSIVLPFGIALFISYLVAPLIKLLENQFKIKKRWINIVIVFIVLIVFFALLFYTIGAIVYTQAKDFLDNDWERILVQIETFIQDNPFLQNIFDKVIVSIEASSESTDILSVLNIFKGIINVIVTVVLVPVFLVFLLHDRDSIFNGIGSVIPEDKRKHLQELGKRANHVVEKYFNGKFLSMFILGSMFTIVLKIFGFSWDKAIFFGFTLGFLDIIPYVGGFVGIALPVLYSFTISDTVLMGEYAFIGLIGINLVLQFLQGNVIQPYIMGKEVNLHPLLVLVSFLFFGALFGVTGVILAIPLTGTIKTTAQYYKEVHDGQRNG